jgi:hypothetical protein
MKANKREPKNNKKESKKTQRLLKGEVGGRGHRV